MLEASTQVDLYDAEVPEAWKIKTGTAPFNNKLAAENTRYRAVAEEIMAALEQGVPATQLAPQLAAVNAACEAMNDYVYGEAKKHLAARRTAAVVGGEHSVPLGLLRALSEQYAEFGILHIDAHADLRQAYEGFTYSHASIMHQALQLPGVKRLVQVAVRDYCADEAERMRRDRRITAFTDARLHEAAFHGATWAALTADILEALPPRVYVSFDIDGLCPALCPHTGTPVPGGLNYAQAVYLLKELADSEHEIIGFDLCETAPHPYDANIGSRLLYKLCCYTRWAARK